MTCLTLTIFSACQTEVKQENAAANASQASTAGNSAGALKGDETTGPTQLEKYFQAGNEYSKNGKFLESIESYRQALKINDSVPAIHYNLANVLVATDKLDEAIREYRQAIKLAPLVPDYHRNLGFAYALQKNGDLAKQKYEELKKIAPVQAEELRLWIQKGNQGG